MARKEKTVVIEAEGRDKGKHFVLTEMSAVKGEAWAMRALLAIARGGVDLPEGVQQMGLAGIAVVGVQQLGKINYAEAEPLLAEMLGCVQAIPDPARPMIRRALVEDDTEEIPTLLHLRKEILGLHLDFFTNAALSTQARDLLARVTS